jgi:glycosyltransferase involved in cell wall biosynthesis
MTEIDQQDASKICIGWDITNAKGKRRAGRDVGLLTTSVIIPTYNRANLLPQTLDTIIGQTQKPTEIIVVDDGSQDATAEVLTRYGALVRHVRIHNSGDLVARNVGLRCATSDLVAFCDSDDLWRPDFLEEMTKLWTYEPDLTAAFSDFVIVRGGIWETDNKFASAPADFWLGARPAGPDLAVFNQPILDRLVRFQPFFQSCIVANRARFIELGGWDEGAGRVVGGDFATTLRLGEFPPIGVITRPLVGIRRHANNYSGDVEAMNLGDSLVLEHVLATRPAARRFTAEIVASIGLRRRSALHAAFTRCDFPAVIAIDRLLLPGQRRMMTRIKAGVARLPAPLSRAVAPLLLTAGSLKPRVVSGRRR